MGVVCAAGDDDGWVIGVSLTSWWVVGSALVVTAAALWMFARSLRKWQQPPPGHGPEADHAESFLSWMTRTRGERG